MQNAAVVIINDTIPCFAYDESIPDLRCIEFSRKDAMITLVWDDKDTRQEKRQKMEFPIDPKVAAVLERNQKIALACIRDKKGENLKTVPLKLV